MNLIQEMTRSLNENLDSGSEIKLTTLKDDNHLLLNVISSSFNGMKKLQRHKLIYGILMEFFENEKIHALKMNLRTKDEI